jgi:hypothetical protein
MASLTDRLLRSQLRELEKKSLAVYQAWTKGKGIDLLYTGAEATARASVLAAANAIVVTYVGSEASATIEVTENSIILKAPDTVTVLTIDLTAAANDTLTELVAVIDALADWTCTKSAGMVGTELSKNLAILSATTTKSACTCVTDRYLYVEAPNSTGDVNVGPGGKIFLRALAYDTLTELVAFLDGLTDYTCTLGSQMDGTELSTGLANVAAASILTTALDFAMTVNPQMVITIPAPTSSEQIIFTGFVGKSTYGSGTSTILVYDGATQKWSEPAGATTVVKESLLKRYTMTAGNALKVKVVNSVEATAGEMAISYDIKDVNPFSD